MSTCYLQSCKRCPFTPSFVSFCTAKGYVLQSERARFANQVNTRQGVEDVQLCLTRVKRSVTCGATDTHRRASKWSNINLPFALFEDDVNCRLLPQVPFATLTPPAVKHHSTSSRPFGTFRQKRILLIFRYLYAPPWRTDIINYVPTRAEYRPHSPRIHSPLYGEILFPGFANPHERGLELYSVSTVFGPSGVMVISIFWFVKPFMYVLILYHVAFCSLVLKV